MGYGGQRTQQETGKRWFIITWLKVSGSMEPKLLVYMRMTGGELTQLRWMY
jgi:hypothetical protein